MKKTLTAFGFLLATLSSTAIAGLLGNDVRLDWLYPDTATSLANITVTAPFNQSYTCCFSDEFAPEGSSVSITISDTTVALSGEGQVFTASSFNGLSLFDVQGTIDDIIGASLVFSSLPNFSSGDISFTADQLLLNLAGADAANQGAWRLEVDLEFAAVPEPATLLLVGLGLAGLGGGQLRKRLKAT